MKRTPRSSLQAELSMVVNQLTQMQFGSLRATKYWQPAINAYRCRDCFIVGVEIAGVERDDLDVQVEPRRLRIQGNRPAPEPASMPDGRVQVFSMEIDYGTFDRELVLPCEVDPGRVTAKYQNGLLWITLPFRAQG